MLCSGKKMQLPCCLIHYGIDLLLLFTRDNRPCTLISLFINLCNVSIVNTFSYMSINIPSLVYVCQCCAYPDRTGVHLQCTKCVHALQLQPVLQVGMCLQCTLQAHSSSIWAHAPLSVNECSHWFGKNQYSMNSVLDLKK